MKAISQLPSDKHSCSPLGLTTKKTDSVQTGWRLIFDLSAPSRRSVNDGIPKGYGAISYESLAYAIKLVQEHGKGCKMIKRDLKSAFRHIPVAASDYWLLIFEWEGQYYVDMCLPFGLRTAPRIFNLFAEAIHWILASLHRWSLSHYPDDFFAVFPLGTNLTEKSEQFDKVINQLGFTKAIDKDEEGTTVMHLGFEIDSEAMEVRLSQNKRDRAIKVITTLTHKSSITFKQADELLGFLSHCCQVIPLGRPFLCTSFSLHRTVGRRHKSSRTHIPSKVKQDLRWWNILLESHSIASRERHTHEIWTDTSGKKGIGGWNKSELFSTRVPSRHRKKHINFKEMFAVLHAFILWHEQWSHGKLILYCDNSNVVQGINKHSIRSPAIRPLQNILLIAAAFDIELVAVWIPTHENTIADAASRHNFHKLRRLGLTAQVNALLHPTISTDTSALRQRLLSFFTTPSLHRRDETTTQASNPTNDLPHITDI